MNIEEAKLYLEHTSKDDFNLEEWQKENRYQAIQVVLKEIERLHSIIKEVREYIEEKVGNEIHDMMYVIDVSDVLEILDKVEENK